MEKHENLPTRKDCVPSDDAQDGLGLPTRMAPGAAMRRRIRWMDDPELLERVLECLLKLP
jgi:hypothetical protein